MTFGPYQAELSNEAGPWLHFKSDGALLASVRLGVTVDGKDLASGARVVDIATTDVEEMWNAPFGKATGSHRVEHREYTIALRSGDATWETRVRIAQDGFAFRYVLPDTAHVLGDETTSIELAPSARVWVLDYQTWYETPRYGSDLKHLAAGAYGFPLLAEVERDQFLLLTESNIDGRTAGAYASFDGHRFTITRADPTLDVDGGHQTPWRVIIAGTLPHLVKSTLVDQLAPPASEATFAPRPGRAAWSWWSSQYSGAYLDVQKRFTDFAAEQGWEHVLVDCGWDAAWVPELVAYASERGIQVHLWSSWSDLDGPQNLEKLALWRSWGVAGVKVDFMESESQDRYRWYDAIIAETARVGLMVNFHGSVIPRGWARTHPHVLSYEAIRGAEYYVFYDKPLTAAHNVIQPFTRNVVGSMDYTPVTFSAPGRETSDAHELALAVVYESGITHFADDPDQYRARPLAASFLAQLPATWDEVRLLDGHPDSFALMARRSGNRWFVGCISANTRDVVVRFNPADLVGGPADVWAIGDDADGLTEATSKSARDGFEVRLAPRGGFVALVTPAGAEKTAAAARPRLAPPDRTQPLIVLTSDRVEIPTDATSLRVPPGWEAEKAHQGWVVTPRQKPEPGDVAVITLEKPGHEGVPVVTHVRILTPLDNQMRDLSLLPFLSAHNRVGPVERGLANGGGDPRDGEPLTVNGQRYLDGLGVSQESAVSFAISGTATRMTGSVGIDDETRTGRATAEVVVDGEVRGRYQLVGNTPAQLIDVNVTGAAVVTLRTTPVSAEEAHVDWLTMRVGTHVPAE
ncbi:glycoside hydrolase family 97 catalytic domain-containing protein [Microbacterium sp. AK009]|uniref:glycoside hydrolase family 97 catalytic domain-containing protein n=1 Tax=Microbacterium sp. AK009 TaxID=2723068 RepID=UPI001C53E760|nr:glycoside hydrolase family 97 catalytic domain-containing protein [Microbacterium sp. AK009]